ncbi:MAG: recombinase family protein [Anaerotignum sp.]|jgi:stage V sporulation protein T|nr:recombinase family protein [Anaerotignum sp.]MCI8868231.1 recombinase family protein [Anaerotignum sp.]
MTETYDIAGYCRISVDDELDRDNTSIENQKAIIADFVSRKFPQSALTFYEDRDRSGYTFEQREGYQAMRPMLMRHQYDILVVKDFSRFSRRNSRGLVELEDLRDQGVRIISIGDNIDYPTYDDWTAIQFRFLINEMPVTDASKKVKSVIKRRQSDGKWICAVPYGYVITNTKTMAFEVEPSAAEVVKMIYDLYIGGWGYKKIANHLTDLNIPTPRMAEKLRREVNGEETKLRVKKEWSIATVQGILENDFYIGTLRQGKYTRKKINGGDRKTDEGEHIVFEKHHEPILDTRIFAMAQEQRRKRTKSNYRGQKKYDNIYSGYLYCGDCGSPMFSMSRDDLKPAYVCGGYHRRGRKACSSHHTRVDMLDNILKEYIRQIKENSADMLERLNESVKAETAAQKKEEEVASSLQKQLDFAYEELKATKRQCIRDIMKHPEREELLEQTYDEMEAELEDKISSLKAQMTLNANRAGAVERLNKISRTAAEVFDGILRKEKLDKTDLDFLIERITVYENRIEVELKADIGAILQAGNFGEQEKNGLEQKIIHQERNQRDKPYTVNVVSGGDPLEIFTDREGEIILKKYSPIGELGAFAKEYAESLAQTAGHITCIVDKDQIIAVSGGGKKEFFEKHISPEMESCINRRTALIADRNDDNFVPVLEDDISESYNHQLIVPIIAEGDAMGAIVFLSKDKKMGEVEGKLAQTAAGFLGKQMEQ